MSNIEIIRTERRRRYSEAEKAALPAEVDRGGCKVAKVARRHGMAESLLAENLALTYDRSMIGLR